jgi:hypothetical protein
MSLIKDTWRQLVRNRLWPIALVLVAAMVAVPMLLAKSPAPAAPAPTPPTSASAAADRAALEPVVARADASQAVRRRHVLGDRKDPFKPAPLPKAKVTKVTTTTTSPGVAGTGGSSAGSTGGSSSGSTGGGITTPVTTPVSGTPVTSTPKPAAKKFPADSLTVRFGTADSNPKTVLKSGQALPDAKTSTDAAGPVLVYLGLSKDGKEALFLVDSSVKADGDGRCVGADASGCDTLRMRAGDTEFLDVADDKGTVTAQYEFDVLAIHAKAGTSAKAAKARRARVSKTEKTWATKARTSLAGAARAGGSANLGAGVGALLGSL